MAKYKKFYIDDKTYRSENKAYEEVNRRRQDYRDGTGDSKVSVYVDEDGRRLPYEHLDFSKGD